jgi:hypothetical protein
MLCALPILSFEDALHMFDKLVVKNASSWIVLI